MTRTQRRPADFYLVDAPAARAFYGTDSPHMLEFDDGIVTFATGFPTLSGTGLAADREAAAAAADGTLLNSNSWRPQGALVSSGSVDSPMNRPSLSVITAVYGNADTLEELWMRVAQTLEAAAIPFELIFVDDACPGGSGAVIARTARRDARVRVVTHPANLGQDRALLSGLRVCTGDAAVLIDADLQDLPEVIPLMAEHLAKTQSDAVFADRRGHYESYARLATSRIYRWLLARLTRLPPRACLFVMMNRRVIDGLLAQPPACPWLLPRLGQVVGVPGSLPFERSPRPAGCSAYTMWRRIHKGASSLLWAVALRGSRERHDR